MARTISVLFDTGRAGISVGPARDGVRSEESSSGTLLGSAHEGGANGGDVVVARGNSGSSAQVEKGQGEESDPAFEAELLCATGTFMVE